MPEVGRAKNNLIESIFVSFIHRPPDASRDVMLNRGFRLTRVAKLVIGSIVAVSLFSNGHARSDSSIAVITIATPAWENVTNEDGTGLYFDILRSVYGPVGVTLKYQIVPWRRAVEMVKQHQADALLGGYYIPPDKGEDLFPTYPIGGEILAALSKRGAVSHWEGYESIAGKVVVWIRGYNYHRYFNAEVDGREIDQEAQGWKLVESGRADFYVENINFLNRYLRNTGVDKAKFDIHVLSSQPLYARFGNTRKSEKLIKIYDARMPALIASGAIEKLFEKWGHPYPPFRPRTE
jgi:polar amino acid transport system substrate-binding protein